MPILRLISDLLGVVILLGVIYFLGRPIVHGAIYYPTSSRGVERMMRLAAVRPGERVIDFGSGDGRLLIAAARAGATAVGYEINPVLVRRSRRAIEAAGVADRATVRWESMWRADLSQYDVIFVYAFPYVMSDLRKKCFREMRPEARLISNAFRIPDWEPAVEEEKALRYQLPAEVRAVSGGKPGRNAAGATG